MAHPLHDYHLHAHHARKKGRSIDTAAYAVGILGNIAVIPQIIKAWEGKAPGLAVATWLMFVAFGLVWLAYAVKHKQKPLIVAQILNLTANVAVVGGWVFHTYF